MKKTLTLVVYAGDRTLWSGQGLTLTVRDLPQNRTLTRRTLTGAAVEIELDLPFDSGQVYPLTVSAPRHRDAWHLVSRADFLRGAGADRVEQDQTVRRLLLVPRPSSSADLAAGWQALQRLGSPLAAAASGLTESAYLALGTAEKMAFLNVEAKLRATTLGGAPLLSRVRGVRNVMPDRLFVYVAADAKDLARRSPDFGAAPGHGVPAGLAWLGAHPDSWKHQQFVEGNMQISFARDPEMWGPAGAATEACYSADVDIDLGRGLSHGAEWLRNHVLEPGHKTEQDLVYGMLYDQGILPQFTLAIKTPSRNTTRRKARRVTGSGTRSGAATRPRG